VTDLIAPAVFAITSILMPPAQYDHEPVRPYQINFVSQEEVNKECRLDVALARLKSPRANALGCTDVDTSTVWIVEGLPDAALMEVWAHERAHLNGWRH
jgi:hypothetical protein